MRKWLAVIVCLVLILLPTSTIRADTSSDVTITATGIVIGAPGGFTVYYISDYEVGLSWTKPTPIGWLAEWDKRIKITIDHGDIDADLENFPVLIHLSDSSGYNGDDVTAVFDEVGTNSKKITVTTVLLEECYVEIEEWDEVSEEAWLWVKVPYISDGVDTVLYLFYDNDHADNDTYVGDPDSLAAEQVWDENFVLVYHMRDDPDASQVRDSTDNNNDGVKKDADEPIEATGKVDKGQDFDGINDYITLPDAMGALVDGSQPFSIEMLFYPPTFVPPDGVWQNLISLWKYYYVSLRVLSDGRLMWVMNGVGADIYAQLPSEGAWYHVCSTYSPTVGKTLNLDGEFISSHPGTGTPVVRTEVNRLGMRAGTDRRYIGLIDEVRISTTVRPVAWLKATYETCWDDLLDFGDEGTLPTVNTMIRGAVGRYPENITDGYLIYYGPGENCSDTGVSLDETASYVYYRAWSELGAGVWSPLYSEGNIGGFGMVGIFLAIVVLGLTALSFFKRAILLSLGASIGWLALGVLLITAPDVTHLGTLDETWVQVLAILFFVMATGCLLWYIAGIGKTRITITDTAGRSWSMWGAPPKEATPNRSQLVKERHRARLRAAREHRRIG